MAFVHKTAVVMAAIAGIQIALAHPGEKLNPMELKREISAQRKYASKISQDLEKCSYNPSYIELHRRATLRRAATAAKLREERGIVRPTSE